MAAGGHSRGPRAAQAAAPAARAGRPVRTAPARRTAAGAAATAAPSWPAASRCASGLGQAPAHVPAHVPAGSRTTCRLHTLCKFLPVTCPGYCIAKLSDKACQTSCSVLNQHPFPQELSSLPPGAEHQKWLFEGTLTGCAPQHGWQP